MTHIRSFLGAAAAACATLALGAQAPQPPAPVPQQPRDIVVTITGPPGLPPKLAVPEFIPIGNDADTIAAAKTIGEVLWDDLNFEREFYLIARDTYKTIPQPPSLDQVPLDRWKELGADGVIVGTVRKGSPGVIVQVRLLQVATGASVFAKEYSGSLNSIATDRGRMYSHTISDEVHLQQRALMGVARTKLAFTSDRDGERITGPVGARAISNIYISDYDGANQRRITVTKSLDLAPNWSPDRKALAYFSYRTGYQDIIVAYLEQGRYTTPAAGTPEKQNYLPVFSPDGTKIAFTSNRDGNDEIYIMNTDGSGVRRLTNHPEIDVTPTWSPAGNQIAFTSNRSGTPQIWIVNVDGSGVQQITRESWCDRATWSPAPYNEIAYASRSGGGFDLRIFDFATRSTRTITDGIGTSEQPTFSPNGRHIAFNSSRAGKEQIFVIDRDGKNLKQLTRAGVNRYPNWSK
jgi:TolB protein